MTDKDPTTGTELTETSVPEPSGSRKNTDEAWLQLDRWIEKLRSWEGRCADCQVDLITRVPTARPKMFLLQTWEGYICPKCTASIPVSVVFSDFGIAQSYLDHPSIQQEVHSRNPSWEFNLNSSGLGYLANICPDCKKVQADYAVFTWVRRMLAQGRKPASENWVPYKGELLDTTNDRVVREQIFPFVVVDSYPLCPDCHSIYLRKKERGEPINLSAPLPKKEADGTLVISNNDLGKVDMPPILFHFAKVVEWDRSSQELGYSPAILNERGYIPFCDAGEVSRISSVKFRGETDMMLLAVDRTRLRPRVVIEPDDLGGENPNVMGSVNLDAVIATFNLGWREDKGEHVIQPNVSDME